MDVQGEIFVNCPPFDTTYVAISLGCNRFALVRHAVRVRVSSCLYLHIHKNTQGGANYHVVHGAGKAANQARIRSKGQFMLLFHCLECCND